MKSATQSWPNSTADYVRRNGLDHLIAFSERRPEKGITDSVNPANRDPLPPEWDDLVRLHQLIRSRKAATVLEFGVGRSTVIIADALQKNERDYGGFWKSSLRRQNLFEVHSVDANRKFIDVTRRNLGVLKNRVHFLRADVVMAEFNSRICTLFRRLPNICPDVIYLDGPDQFSPRNHVRGITTAHQDRLPMAADILTIEHFLLPGTMIVVDGRTANARFLKANVQRNWTYEWNQDHDAHYFELMEKPLGRFNAAQVEFCLGKEWIRRADAR